MAVTFKPLAEGQLAAAKATLYTAPASTETVVLSIILVNTDTSARTVNLYANITGTSRRLIPKNMSLGAGYRLAMTEKITLQAADFIEGDASAATVVDYIISGMEKT